MAIEIMTIVSVLFVAGVTCNGWLRAFASYKQYRAAREAAALRRMIRQKMSAIADDAAAPQPARTLAARDLGVWSNRNLFRQRAAEWKGLSDLPADLQARYEREGNAIREALPEAYRESFDALYNCASLAACLEDESPRLYEEALKFVRLHRREQRQRRIVYSLRPQVSPATEIGFGQERQTADRGYACA